MRSIPGANWIRDTKPPVVVASAAYGGTLAAVRDLGSRGIDVRVVTGPHLGAASWSQWSNAAHRAPSEKDADQFLARLLEIGQAEPGQVLLPTSDDTAWLYTENAAELQRYFRLYQPSIDSMRRILDKNLFAEAAIASNVGIIPSWDPHSMDEVRDLAPSLPYPVLIKPRTHVHRVRNDKGVVVHSAAELLTRYELYLERERERTAYTPLLEDAAFPVLQQYIDKDEGAHSVTGFVDRTGELFVSRHASKVFQRGKPVGVGVCFESRPADPELSDAVRRLCRELGYFGMFEVEFLRYEGGWGVIDFNPRTYNQLWMDVRRGMPLPFFAYLGAAGETQALGDAVAMAAALDESVKYAIYDGFTLRAILIAQALTARSSRRERAAWRAWTSQREVEVMDISSDEGDRLPGLIHAVSELYLGIQALPRFLRATPRTALGPHWSLRGALRGLASPAVFEKRRP